MTHFKPEQLIFIHKMREHVLNHMKIESSSDLLVRLARYVEGTSEEILNERELTELQRAGIQRAAMDTPKSIGVLHDIIVDQSLTRSQKEDLLFCLAKLIDDALEIGFYHALDRKSLRRSDRLIEGGQSGGKQGSVSRKRKADEWKVTVDLEIARIRRDKPDLSQDKLADEILFAWTSEDPPGHQSVTKHISRFDKAVRSRLGNEGGSST